MIGRSVLPQLISSNIQSELIKDERINDVLAEVNLSGNVLTIICRVQDDDGPFEMTFTVDQRSSGEQIVLEFDESI